MNKIDRNVRRKIQRRNAKFQVADRIAQRRMIVLDAIAQIKAKRFIPESGSYCSFSNSEVMKIESIFGNTEQLREHFLAGNLTKCSVCAIGALMVSTILFKNQIKVDDCLYYSNHNPESKQLLKFFTNKELNLIEIAFETYRTSTHGLEKKAYEFGIKHSDESKRLLAILENMASDPKSRFRP